MVLDSITGTRAVITKESSKTVSGRVTESGKNIREIPINMKATTSTIKSKATVSTPGASATPTKATITMTFAKVTDRCTGSMAATTKDSGEKDASRVKVLCIQRKMERREGDLPIMLWLKNTKRYKLWNMNLYLKRLRKEKKSIWMINSNIFPIPSKTNTKTNNNPNL